MQQLKKRLFNKQNGVSVQSPQDNAEIKNLKKSRCISDQSQPLSLSKQQHFRKLRFSNLEFISLSYNKIITFFTERCKTIHPQSGFLQLSKLFGRSDFFTCRNQNCDIHLEEFRIINKKIVQLENYNAENAIKFKVSWIFNKRSCQ